MERHMKKILVSLATLAAMASGAEAHLGVGHTHGFIHGFMHPIGGADHVLAGLVEGQRAGRPPKLPPAAKKK